jgi:hypothetical protein
MTKDLEIPHLSPLPFEKGEEVLFSPFVIPSEVEEWSEWDERHGPLGREGSGERVGRRTSSIAYYFCRFTAGYSRKLDMTGQ